MEKIGIIDYLAILFVVIIAIFFILIGFKKRETEEQEFYDRYINYMHENYDNVECIKYEEITTQNCSIEHRASTFYMHTYCYIDNVKYYIVFEEYNTIPEQLKDNLYTYNVYLQQIEN